MTKLKITLSGKNKERELKAKSQIERLVKTYNLERYILSSNITIEYHATPEAHTDIALNTLWVEDDDMALASFLHEQMHLIGNVKSREVEKTLRQLSNTYSNIPIGKFLGAKSTHSNYVHIIINFLEYKALREVLGKEKAREIIEKRANLIYKWIYKKVIEDYDKLQVLFSKNGILFF